MLNKEQIRKIDKQNKAVAHFLWIALESVAVSLITAILYTR